MNTSQRRRIRRAHRKTERRLSATDRAELARFRDLLGAMATQPWEEVVRQFGDYLGPNPVRA